jgi:hypothetical protein
MLPFYLEKDLHDLEGTAVHVCMFQCCEKQILATGSALVGRAFFGTCNS